jgi:hypothetical protein
MSLNIEYRGPGVVQEYQHSYRTELGLWTTVQIWNGIYGALESYCAGLPVGYKVDIQNYGPYGRATITFVNNPFQVKWEIDSDLLNQDLLLLKACQPMSQHARAAFKLWKQSGALSAPALPSSGTTVPLYPGDTSWTGVDDVILASLQTEVLRGAETYQVATVILKLSQQAAIAYTPAFPIVQQTRFFTTASLIYNFGIPSNVQGDLPNDGSRGGSDPYPAPVNAAWGWLPRLRNKSFIGRGLVELQMDWVYAAWSTFIYGVISNTSGGHVTG